MSNSEWRLNNDRLNVAISSTQMLDCQGDGCHIEYSDGLGLHCLQCYGEMNIEDITEAKRIDKRIGFRYPPIEGNEKAIIIQCGGLKCNIHIDDGRNLHCYSCYGNAESLPCQICHGTCQMMKQMIKRFKRAEQMGQMIYLVS